MRIYVTLMKENRQQKSEYAKSYEIKSVRASRAWPAGKFPAYTPAKKEGSLEASPAYDKTAILQ
jgi:hypothetical protein